MTTHRQKGWDNFLKYSLNAWIPEIPINGIFVIGKDWLGTWDEKMFHDHINSSMYLNIWPLAEFDLTMGELLDIAAEHDVFCFKVFIIALMRYICDKTEYWMQKDEVPTLDEIYSINDNLCCFWNDVMLNEVHSAGIEDGVAEFCIALHTFCHYELVFQGEICFSHVDDSENSCNIYGIPKSVVSKGMDFKCVRCRICKGVMKTRYDISECNCDRTKHDAAAHTLLLCRYFRQFALSYVPKDIIREIAKYMVQ